MVDPTEYVLLAIMEGARTDRAGAEMILARHSNAVLDKAIEAAREEYLTDDTGDEADEAYNRGVADAVAAIDALKASQP